MSLRVFRGLEDLPLDFGPCALTIGNFDGVHAAHQSIMRRVAALARDHGWTATVLTFDPHPAQLLNREQAPRLLTSIVERTALIEASGIEAIVVLPFTREIAALTPEEFALQILADRMHARVVLVGGNFRFGNRAAGDTGKLAELGAQLGFATEIAGTERLHARMVSSSEIRRLIETGNIYLAGRMLRRPYSLEGAVVPGHGVGSKQTVPTLNLETRAEVLPKAGVYVTRTHSLGGEREWPSITNVGFRPTFNGDRLTIETFLLAPLDGDPPLRIRVEFLHRVRDERKFESADALRAQIFRDVTRAREFFRRNDIIKK